MSLSPQTLASLGIANPTSAYPIQMRPVIIDPPMGAKTFIPNGSAVMPAQGAQAVICQYLVPANNSAVVWRLGNGTALGGGIANWRNGSGDLVWQLLKNGSPFENMDDIVSIVGLVENMGGLLPGFLWAPQNTLIQLVVTNVNVAAARQNLVGLFGGWRYPGQLDPQQIR